MPGRVCVDASLVLAVLLREDYVLQARAQWRSWIAAETEIVAPPLFFAEVTSVLRSAVYFGRITHQEGETAFAEFMGMSVVCVDGPDLQRRAWFLAQQYNRPRAYDAQYLAAAELVGCELWTAASDW